MGRVFSRFSRSSKVTRFAKLQEKREQESQVHWTGIQGAAHVPSLGTTPGVLCNAWLCTLDGDENRNTMKMALGDTGACCSHEEQHCAHTQDKEHAATTGLPAPKGQTPLVGKGKPHGTGPAAHQAPGQQQKSESNIIRQSTSAWEGTNRHSEHREKLDLRRLDQSLLCHKPQQDKQLGLQEGPLTAQSCTWLVPAGAATILVPAARCPQPSPSPGLPERAILTSQCQWGGSAGTHRSGPGGPGSAAG